MPLKKEEKSKKHETTVNSQRRVFLKKAAYATPSIVALGALMKPTEAEAGFGNPPSGPATWN